MILVNRYTMTAVFLMFVASMNASSEVMSPRGRALAEEFRKVKGETSERLVRTNVVGTPRGIANDNRSVRGVTVDSLNRSIVVGSPRGLANWK